MEACWLLAFGLLVCVNLVFLLNDVLKAEMYLSLLLSCL
ncbi:hypothetical protein SAMN05518856_10310 [Paenibacillus sp. OK003]|nr:hypothetical protein SAMN05518856_10310 [Paenibacillus sp. OK003]